MTYIINNPNAAQRAQCEKWKAERSDVKEVVGSEDSDDYIPLIKEEFITDFRESLREMRQHLQGKIKLKTMKEYLDELRSTTYSEV